MANGRIVVPSQVPQTDDQRPKPIFGNFVTEETLQTSSTNTTSLETKRTTRQPIAPLPAETPQTGRQSKSPLKKKVNKPNKSNKPATSTESAKALIKADNAELEAQLQKVIETFQSESKACTEEGLAKHSQKIKDEREELLTQQGALRGFIRISELAEFKKSLKAGMADYLSDELLSQKINQHESWINLSRLLEGLNARFLDAKGEPKPITYHPKIETDIQALPASLQEKIKGKQADEIEKSLAQLRVLQEDLCNTLEEVMVAFFPSIENAFEREGNLDFFYDKNLTFAPIFKTEIGRVISLTEKAKQLLLEKSPEQLIELLKFVIERIKKYETTNKTARKVIFDRILSPLGKKQNKNVSYFSVVGFLARFELTSAGKQLSGYHQLILHDRMLAELDRAAHFCCGKIASEVKNVTVQREQALKECMTVFQEASEEAQLIAGQLERLNQIAKSIHLPRDSKFMGEHVLDVLDTHLNTVQSLPEPQVDYRDQKEGSSTASLLAEIEAAQKEYVKLLKSVEQTYQAAQDVEDAHLERYKAASRETRQMIIAANRQFGGDVFKGKGVYLTRVRSLDASIDQYESGADKAPLQEKLMQISERRDALQARFDELKQEQTFIQDTQQTIEKIRKDLSAISADQAQIVPVPNSVPPQFVLEDKSISAWQHVTDQVSALRALIDSKDFRSKQKLLIDFGQLEQDVFVDRQASRLMFAARILVDVVSSKGEENKPSKKDKLVKKIADFVADARQKIQDAKGQNSAAWRLDYENVKRNIDAAERDIAELKTHVVVFKEVESEFLTEGVGCDRHRSSETIKLVNTFKKTLNDRDAVVPEESKRGVPLSQENVANNKLFAHAEESIRELDAKIMPPLREALDQIDGLRNAALIAEAKAAFDDFDYVRQIVDYLSTGICENVDYFHSLVSWAGSWTNIAGKSVPGSVGETLKKLQATQAQLTLANQIDLSEIKVNPEQRRAELERSITEMRTKSGRIKEALDSIGQMAIARDEYKKSSRRYKWFGLRDERTDRWLEFLKKFTKATLPQYKSIDAVKADFKKVLPQPKPLVKKASSSEVKASAPAKPKTPPISIQSPCKVFDTNGCFFKMKQEEKKPATPSCFTALRRKMFGG